MFLTAQLWLVLSLCREDSNKENRAFNDGSSDGSEGGVNQAGRGFSRQASGDKPHRGGRGGRRGRGGRGSSGNRGGGFVKHTGFLVDQTSAFTSDDDFNKNGWDHGQNFDAPLNGSSGSEPVWQKKPGKLFFAKNIWFFVALTLSELSWWIQLSVLIGERA